MNSAVTGAGAQGAGSLTRSRSGQDVAHRSNDGQNGEVRDPLRLFPDDGAESPVWSRLGRVPLSQLAISESLAADLMAWQEEALDPLHPLADRSEDEWEADGRILAARLIQETGRQVDVYVEQRPGDATRGPT